MIGGGELKIDPTKMEAIVKWTNPTNVIEVKRFVEKTWYLQNVGTCGSIVNLTLLNEWVDHVFWSMIN